MVLGLELAATVEVSAQTPTAALTGVVRDSTGGALATVDLTVRNTAVGYEYRAVTSSTGRYWLRGLPPGDYELTAKRIGVAPATREGITLGVGETATLDLTLRIAPVEVTGLVVSAEPLLETTKSRVAFRLSQEQIARLPEESREFVDLAKYLPGVTEASDLGTIARFGSAASVGALNATSVGVLVDGGDFTEPAFGELSGGVPLLAIQEFEVIQSTYSAQHGRAASGVLNAVTRRGSNHFGLEAFGLFRDRRLNALGEFEGEKPKYAREHWGFAASGPISTDRTHYFLAFERKTEDIFATIETDGLFPAEEGTFKTPFENNLLFARVDHRLDNRHELSLRYSGNLGDRLGNVGPGAGGIQSFDQRIRTSLNQHSAMLTHRWAITPGLLNEARLHVIRREFGDRPANADEPGLCYPTLCIGGGGGTTSINSTRLELIDDLSLVAAGASGTHRLKFGTQLSWLRNDIGVSFFGAPLFAFAADDATDPFLAFAPSGEPEVALDQGNVQLGFFMQDDWNPTPRLTLNLGLRYDVETNGTNQGFVSPFAGQLPFIRTTPRPIDGNNLAPRLGFAWDPAGRARTVIRGGFGVFYDKFIGYPLLALERASGSKLILQFGPGTTDPDKLSFDPATALPDIWPNAAEMKTPLTRQFSLGVEQALPWDVVVRLDGMYIQGRNLLIERQINVFDPNTGPAFPDFNLASQVLTEGESSAKLLLFDAKKRFEGGWVDVNYTLGDRKNTNDNWNDFAPGPLDPEDTDFSGLMAPAGWDERHRLAVTGAASLAAGLGLSLKTVYASARPYSAFTFKDLNGNFFPDDIAPGEQRNGRRGPDFFRADLGLMWDLDVWRDATLGLRLNIYNLFNTTNFDPESVVTTVESPLFSQPAAAFARRQLELGVHVRW